MGLSTGWQIFSAVVQVSLITLLCITNMEFKIPYKVPHGLIYVLVLTYVISYLPNFSECDFFANLLGLGLSSIILPPFMLYL